ncbi:MAG: RAMP superfamily CRISPR-associated protein [Anaerolineales bacterium]
MSLDYFVELAEKTSPQSAEEFTTRYHSLIANGKKKEADALRGQWSKQAGKVALSEPDSGPWQMIAKPSIELALLPFGSWFLKFTFTLAKPYISKDDTPFYIIDNPIVRDKVFGLPMVRSTAWKGNLYSALWQLGHDKQDDEQMQRLFGEMRGEEGGQAGRLYFYPTFFTQTSLEIINPHDRKRRVGKNPILFESVPSRAKGTFSLLYVPFDLIGQDEEIICKQALEDLQRVAEGIKEMMRTYGFSAKRTSGYGVAQEHVSDGQVPTPPPIEHPASEYEVAQENNGFFQIRIEEPSSPPVSPSPPAKQELPKYLQAPGKLKDEYLTPEGTFRERSQAELAQMTKAQRQEYEKAKKWWEREGKALSEKPPAPAEPAPKPTRQWFKRKFDTFEKLLEEVSKAQKALLPEGGRNEPES